MPVADIKNHLLAQVVPPAEHAPRLRYYACCLGVLFFVCTFIGTLVSAGELSSEGAMIVSMVNATEHPTAIQFPQITLCPFWPQGVIHAVTCQEVIHGQKTPHLLIAKPLDHGHYADHPDWGCMSYNYDGTAIAGLNSHVFCQINSTNTGKDANGAPITWPGRVRAYIDAPGTTEFLHCEDCVMGVDGAVLVANHTSWAFWQAVKTTLEGQHWIDYRTTSGGMARPLVFDKQAHSDIDAFFGFYTTEVMQYRTVSDLGGEISGEVFARTVTFLAALLLASWGISRCIGTFLILLLIGQDALADGEEKRAILN